MNLSQPGRIAASRLTWGVGVVQNEGVFAVWASGGVYAVVLSGAYGVRAFTVVSEGEGYEVIEG